MGALTTLLVAASCFLAAGGGLGGGALLVPIYLVVAKLEAHQAIGLSNFTICCGALASFLINVRRTHPSRPGRSIIDWSMVLMLEPLTVLGAMVGGYVNKVQPPWLTTILLGVLLCVMAAVLARKWWSQTIVERRTRQEQHNATGRCRCCVNLHTHVSQSLQSSACAAHRPSTARMKTPHCSSPSRSLWRPARPTCRDGAAASPRSKSSSTSYWGLNPPQTRLGRRVRLRSRTPTAQRTYRRQKRARGRCRGGALACCFCSWAVRLLLLVLLSA